MGILATVKNKIVKLTILDNELDSKPNKTSVLSTQERILRFLLVNRSISNTGWTVKEIANKLDLSSNLIRQNLILLEKEQLLIRARIKNQIGRPSMTYSIHENAFDLFPKKYMDFSLALISAFKAYYGTEELVILLQAVGKTLAKKMTKNGSGINQNDVNFPFKQKLENKISLLDKAGYYTELIEDETSFLLKNYNCTLFKLVKNEPLVCVLCETLLTEFLGKKVVKCTGISSNAAPCIFRLEK